MFRRMFLLIAALLAVNVSAIAAPPAETTFTLLRGRAALSRTNGATWLDLGPQPVVVKSQDRLRTEGEARGELTFPDGSLVRIMSGSMLTLFDGGVQFQVGEAWFDLTKQQRQFQVVTPTAACGVLGTTFDVGVDRFGKTSVRVFKGMVWVRANTDPRRRQLVLQRGMMTEVKNRAAIDGEARKFDALTEERRSAEAWSGSGAAPVRFGPARPELSSVNRQELPPMRPALPVDPGVSGRPGLGRPGEGVGEELEEQADRQEPSEIRERLQFFDRLRNGRRPDGPSGSDARSDAGPAGTWGRAPLPGRFAGGLERPALSPEQEREGLDRPFGQATAWPLGAADQERIRDELAQVRSEITSVREDIPASEARLRGLTSVPGTMSSEAQVQVRGLQERLLILRDRLHRLLQREDDLRKRLH